MVSASESAMPSSPEGSGEEATTREIKKIRELFDRVGGWWLLFVQQQCPKNPSIAHSCCTECQELEEKYGERGAPYDDLQFKVRPHAPQMKSVMKNFVILIMITLRRCNLDVLCLADLMELMLERTTR